jgi:hypothetical protein
VDELRERLRARIAALKAERAAKGLGKDRGATKNVAKRSRHTDASDAGAARHAGASGGSASSGGSADLGDSLSFGTISAVPKGLAGIKSRDMSAGGKKRPSLHRLLEAAESRKAQIDALKGTEEGDKIKADHEWDAALRRASGEKVRDDPKLLKRTIKRKESLKKKSAKAWDDRKKQQQADRVAKQDRREANLAKRREGKGKGKGHRKTAPNSRAGFEGSARASLN